MRTKTIQVIMPLLLFAVCPAWAEGPTLAQGGGDAAVAGAVATGDWAALKRLLAGRPVPEALQAYAGIVGKMRQNFVSTGVFYQVSAGPDAAAQAGSLASLSVMFPEDLVALMDAAPGDIPAAAVADLGALAGQILGPDGQPTLLRRIGKGFKGIGGTIPEGRRNAAVFLDAAGWQKECAPYLPLARAEWKTADEGLLRLTLEYLTMRGKDDNDSNMAALAANLLVHLLESAPTDAASLQGSLVQIVPMLPEPDALRFVERLVAKPEQLAGLLNGMSESVTKGVGAQGGEGLSRRAGQLALARKLLDVLADKVSPEMTTPLLVLWLTEAERTYRANVVRPYSEVQLKNLQVRTTADNLRLQNSAANLTRDVILAHSPSDAMMARLPEGLQRRARLTLLKVKLMAPEDPASLAVLRDYLAQAPGLKVELCEDFLNSWVRFRSNAPTDEEVQKLISMGVTPVLLPPDGAIPLTRLEQKKNLADFARIVAELRELSGGALSPRAVVSGFVRIHGKAEVYRIEDIEAVLGPLDKMGRAESVMVLTTMLGLLNEQWRDVKLQQEMGTRRDEKETMDEVSRGYQVAVEIARKTIRDEDASWQDLALRGNVFFTVAEYEHARRIRLSEYVNLRDGSFASYRKAVERYAGEVMRLPRSQWTVGPFDSLFHAMLGASDLGKLTPSTVRADAAFEKIGGMMDALPEDAVAWHRRTFIESLTETCLGGMFPPHMRQVCLAAGVSAVGENQPGAEQAVRTLQSYRELLDEAQLRVTVDGAPEVGTSEPFGLFISLVHTRQIARESGGFGQYLANATGQGPKFRDNFLEYIRSALTPSFELISMQLRDPGVQSIDIDGRDGWQETPLAYVLLRARDASVDRIPPIQIDLHFSNKDGLVVLPVVSPNEAVDAAAYTPPIAVPQLEMVFSLDDRKWATDGSVVIEARARGRGPIPAAGVLFDFEQPGFEAHIKDEGMRVESFHSDNRMRYPATGRAWIITYNRRKDVRGDVMMNFPELKPGVTAASVTCQRFVDADLVNLDAGTATAGIRLHSAMATGLGYGFWLLLVPAAILGWLVLRKMARRAPVREQSGMELPVPLTPFSAAAFLRRLLRASPACSVETARQHIESRITEIEASCFRQGAGSLTDSELESIIRDCMKPAR